MLNALKKWVNNPATAEPSFQNLSSQIEFEKLGKTIPPYLPTYDFKNSHLNKFQQLIANCPLEGDVKIDLGITGSLRRADALKLYEMAYLSRGDILELGCNQGLSTSILSQANHESGLKKKILTNDLDQNYVNIARQNLEGKNLLNKVELVADDAVDLCGALAKAGREFSFCFIDHAHSYQPVYDVTVQLSDVISPGGFCLFHDYNDRRNPKPEEDDYRVAQAVDDGFKNSPFEFWGMFGCTAMFRKSA